MLYFFFNDIEIFFLFFSAGGSREEVSGGGELEVEGYDMGSSVSLAKIYACCILEEGMDGSYMKCAPFPCEKGGKGGNLWCCIYVFSNRATISLPLPSPSTTAELQYSTLYK